MFDFVCVSVYGGSCLFVCSGTAIKRKKTMMSMPADMSDELLNAHAHTNHTLNVLEQRSTRKTHRTPMHNITSAQLLFNPFFLSPAKLIHTAHTRDRTRERTPRVKTVCVLCATTEPTTTTTEKAEDVFVRRTRAAERKTRGEIYCGHTGCSRTGSKSSGDTHNNRTKRNATAQRSDERRRRRRASATTTTSTHSHRNGNDGRREHAH